MQGRAVPGKNWDRFSLSERLGETVLFGHGRRVHRSREASAPIAGEDSDRSIRVAEGATAPESLRQKDRNEGWTLWKASSCAKALEDHRWGKPSEALGRRRAKLSGFPTEGAPVKMPAVGIAGPCRETPLWAK